MKLHHLKPAKGAKQNKRRVGRGRAGHGGKTAGRGTKGWGARNQPMQGFEGGQMPLIRRVPKRKGFRNPNREPFAAVNVAQLAAAFGAGEIDTAAMVKRGLVRKGMKVKVLADGDLSVAIVVKAQAFSEAAKAKIEGAGGRAEVVPE